MSTSDAVQRLPGPFPWRSLIVALVLLGLAQFGAMAWDIAKSSLARALIAQAWSRTLMGESSARPWPGADAWPIARLRVPALGIERYVLASAREEGLEFGPGHLAGTPVPGDHGNSVIRGRGDAQFAFLGEMRLGDVIEIQRADGRWIAYRVVEGAVLDRRDIWVAKQEGPDRLTLVTGYPFNAAHAFGHRRYVVFAFELRDRGGERGLRG